MKPYKTKRGRDKWEITTAYSSKTITVSRIFFFPPNHRHAKHISYISSTYIPVSSNIYCPSSKKTFPPKYWELAKLCSKFAICFQKFQFFFVLHLYLLHIYAYKYKQKHTCWFSWPDRVVKRQWLTAAFHILGYDTEVVISSFHEVGHGVRCNVGLDTGDSEPRWTTILSSLNDVRADSGTSIRARRVPGQCQAVMGMLQDFHWTTGR